MDIWIFKNSFGLEGCDRVNSVTELNIGNNFTDSQLKSACELYWNIDLQEYEITYYDTRNIIVLNPSNFIPFLGPQSKRWDKVNSNQECWGP